VVQTQSAQICPDHINASVQLDSKATQICCVKVSVVFF
jgi:hypothetical protein